MRSTLGKLLATACLAGLAGCATQRSAPLALPGLTPYPVAMNDVPAPIPPRPRPPIGANPAMAVPGVGLDGVRQTVNAHLSSAQTVWNVRSGLNVAALNCREPEDQPIIDAYTALLKQQAKALKSANKTLDGEYRQEFGARYKSEQDLYNTRVYNYFALPMVHDDFCAAARTVASGFLLIPPDNLETYATGTLPVLDRPFVLFFDSYDRYRRDLAAWNEKYGPSEVAPAPAGTLEAASATVPLDTLRGSPVSAASAASLNAPARAGAGGASSDAVGTLLGEPVSAGSTPVLTGPSLDFGQNAGSPAGQPASLASAAN